MGSGGVNVVRGKGAGGAKEPAQAAGGAAALLLVHARPAGTCSARSASCHTGRKPGNRVSVPALAPGTVSDDTGRNSSFQLQRHGH